jgi:ParB family chromosome partitioning protein
LVLSKGLSVRQTEELVREQTRTHSSSRKPTSTPPQWRSIQDDLQRRLSTKVRLVKGRGKGKVEIEFYSEADLERIWRIICGREQ